jgi:hypothetical protein
LSGVAVKPNETAIKKQKKNKTGRK